MKQLKTKTSKKASTAKKKEVRKDGYVAKIAKAKKLFDKGVKKSKIVKTLMEAYPKMKVNYAKAIVYDRLSKVA